MTCKRLFVQNTNNMLFVGYQKVVNMHSCSHVRAINCILHKLIIRFSFADGCNCIYMFSQPFEKSDTYLLYWSPSVNSSLPMPITYNVSIEMDGVRSPLQSAMLFTIKDDPVLDQLSATNNIFRGELLRLPVGICR